LLFFAIRMRMNLCQYWTPQTTPSATFRKVAMSVFLVCLVICDLPGHCLAGESSTWVIHLTVVDESNQPVPDATVEVRLAEKLVSTSRTDAAGKVTLTVNLPGTYSLKIDKKGSLPNETTLQAGEGNAGQNLDIDVVLSTVALSQQRVEVRGEASNPITETSSDPSTLTPTQAKDTPLRPATLIDALPLIPGIVRGPDGSVRIAGFGEDHSALLVNSVDVTDPATGGFGLSVPIDSVQTIEVSEMPYLAEYGRFTAGVVAANTRRGGEKLDYSLNDPLPDFFIRSGHLDGVRDAAPRFNLSGPIIANRLYFLEGVEYLLDKQEVYTLPFPQSLSTSKAFNSFTQFDAIVSPDQTLTGSFHFAPHTLQYAGLDYFNPQPVTPNGDFHETTVALTDRLALGGGFCKARCQAES
jgi:hypothetical protein